MEFKDYDSLDRYIESVRRKVATALRSRLSQDSFSDTDMARGIYKEWNVTLNSAVVIVGKYRKNHELSRGFFGTSLHKRIKAFQEGENKPVIYQPMDRKKLSSLFRYLSKKETLRKINWDNHWSD